MKIVLLSGGSGQRLWPLSNDNCSKQYIKFIKHDENVEDAFLTCSRNENCSMLQRVYEQFCEVGLGDEVIIAASESQREIVFSQLGDKVKFSAEPLKRDTFPAVLLASSFVKSKCQAMDDEVLTFVPVDPYVNLGYFEKIIELANLVADKEDVIGLMGATPTYPSEKYGYIRVSADGDKAEGFDEKPNINKARELIESGALWNCGVFCFKVGTAARWAERYNLAFDYDVLYESYNYLKLPKISFDYEVLEKSKDIIVVSYDGMWKDIGTWNTLTEEMNERTSGNVVVDEISTDCHVINTLDVPVILMGGKKLVVAASRDGILVADKEQSSFLKKCLEKIDIPPMYEERKWGNIKTLERSVEENRGVVTNMVKVEDGLYTSYHRHFLHDEIITVVSGEGVLILENKSIPLTTGSAVTIGRGALHAIKAYTKLKYVEVLVGEVGVDDIERISFEIPCMDN